MAERFGQTPWQTVWEYITVIRSPKWHLFHSPQYNYILLWYLLIALFALGVLLASWRRLGWELTLFGMGPALIFLCCQFRAVEIAF